MAGDSTNRGDEDLVSQIEELKARMDRLMKGGTSTSNSALLTDAIRPQQPEPAVDEPAAATPAERTRVRDLIGPRESEVIEVYPGAADVVEFPDDDISSQSGPPEASSSPAPPNGGSLINVPEDGGATRAGVSRFDDLGDAIQQELARDESVPPLEAKKGPDLASRFGSPDEGDHTETEAIDSPDEDTPDEPMAETEFVEEDEEDLEAFAAPASNAPSRIGRVAAIWVATGIASGAIATLHFTGVI